MVNQHIYQCDSHEAERNAYNAAFHELGFRWYWDSETYAEIMSLGANPKERIGHYLETRHPHLLKAYDAAFLAVAIGEVQLRKRLLSGNTAASAYFNWAETLTGEIGA